MSNELAKETSPYLLQHADNPVEWFAWNDDALRLSRERDKPILLSVGYSACHWCHVMAHESFEDPATAALMNELFVNIKVDREERPDIDKIYQSAHQLIARAPGGWPLTVFLTPAENVPIFTGTYFPRELFQQVLRRVEAYFRTHEDDIREHGQALAEALESLDPSSQPHRGQLTAAPVASARKRLEASFDIEYGGFGGAPKFPHPTNVETLLGVWRASADTPTPDLQALYMATLTLSRMASHGLYDHLGGGFFRYAVDGQWAIPHFEKMLYDNAALLAVYADAYAATGEANFGRVASQTADWVMRDMQDAQGGYYATLDADSEGEEGKFYLWTPEELTAVLDEDEHRLAIEHFGLDRAANFEGKAWHLHAAKPLEAPSEHRETATREGLLDSVKTKLLAAREARVAPARDEKVLVSWNGLMIKGMARAAMRLGRPELAASATRAVDFIRSRLRREGRLMACYKDQQARFAAYLDDHAFLADGLLELLRYRWRAADLVFACELADTLLTHFEDPRGGFFFTADDHEALIHRPKPFSDEATPSGNGIAVRVLLRLGHLLGEQRYAEAAERALRAAWPVLERYPEAHGSLLQGLETFLNPPELIIIRGEPAVTEEWKKYVDAGYHPNRLSFSIPGGEERLPGLLAERRPRGEAVAYLCQGTRCREPVTSLEMLAAALGERAAP